MRKKCNKYLLAGLMVIGRSACFAQIDPHSTAIYSSVPGIHLVTGDGVQDKIGIYELGDPLSGYILTLELNMHFRVVGHSCMEISIRDSGTWFVFSTGRIGLKSVKGTQITFDLVQFDHYYFCIAPDERAKFVKDYLALGTRFKDEKPIRDNDRVETLQDLVAHWAMNDFYLRDLNHRYPDGRDDKDPNLP